MSLHTRNTSSAKNANQAVLDWWHNLDPYEQEQWLDSQSSDSKLHPVKNLTVAERAPIIAARVDQRWKGIRQWIASLLRNQNEGTEPVERTAPSILFYGGPRSRTGDVDQVRRDADPLELQKYGLKAGVWYDVIQGRPPISAK